jgi:TonB family protein
MNFRLSSSLDAVLHAVGAHDSWLGARAAPIPHFRKCLNSISFPGRSRAPLHLFDKKMPKPMNDCLRNADKRNESYKGRGGPMNNDSYKKSPIALKRAAFKLLQAGVVALLVILAMPTGAVAQERATRSKVAPIYPDIARRMRIVGAVEVEATVDAAGNVSDAKAVAGNRILAIAAEDAVRKWKFAPGPGTTTVKVEINFEPAQ